MGNELQTKYLKLTKPISGSNNWGNAINANWNKIDEQYGLMKSSINSLEERLGEVGVFKFLYRNERNPFADADTKPNLEHDYIYVQIVSSSSFTVGYKSSQTNKYRIGYTIKLDESITSDSHISIFDNYTAFYVETGGTLTIEQQSISFTVGDVLVIVKEIINNKLTTTIKKLSQALGSSYIPTQPNANNYNEIQWNKTLNTFLPDNVTLHIPTCWVYSMEGEATIMTTDTTKEIDTTLTPYVQITTEDKQTITAKQSIIKVHFVEKDTNKTVYLDYDIVYPTLSTDTIKIIVHNKYGFNGTCRYAWTGQDLTPIKVEFEYVKVEDIKDEIDSQLSNYATKVQVNNMYSLSNDQLTISTIPTGE
jgi:hypothetical protein